ncbi:hybrid sensor histidine kinase/response regulator [Mesonia aquimarina]|uniref:hybrid sensor histidine kinase/response regulator n=1 Tax=Mesonia aquimarina TaxID=1504967 RepID=UPI0013CEFC22|nr:ATP-binding protein [Mesonia aquimarina]
MKNTKRSITFKVLAGYILLSAVAVITVWFVYGKIVSLTQVNTLGNQNNQRLILISDAVTSLYTAEGISRNIIQNQRVEDLPKFNAEIDTISILIDSLKKTYTDDEIIPELDSINQLLSLKEKNLVDLLALRKQNNSENYYDRVLNELEKTNYLFEDDNYQERLKQYKPYVREVLVKYLEYAKEDNANTLTQQSADSLINSMKAVLSKLENEERRYQNTISTKENELLQNDRKLSAQLRNLRAEIEQEEVQKSVAQVTESRNLIQETSSLILVLGIACMLIILLFVILILKDTNRSQQYRSELEKAKSYAEFLLKQREQFMATVTHDLRSPLNTIAGYSDLLQKSSLSEKQQHYLHQLKKSSGYILHLVNDLLDFSKLDAGKMRVEKLPFNPKNVIQDSIDGVIPSEDPKNLQLHVNVEKKLDQNFLSDPFRIQQILTNLIGNAYKFTEKGEIIISAVLDTSSLQSKKLKITIQDSGIGISKKQQKIIFEEFSQAKASIEKKYGGSGLGLAITKKLVGLLGGNIQLESKPTKGSTFIISLPVENAKRTFSSTVTEQIQLKNAKNKFILIVDDEQSQLALTQEIVKQNGLKFESTTSAKKALKICKRKKIDLILSDIQMPEMNGFQFIRKLKASAKTKEIPVVALSGRTEMKQETYTEKGFETNIIKPFHANELIQIIARILDLETEKIAQAPSKKSTKSKEDLFQLEDLKVFTDNDEGSLKAILDSFIESTRINLEALQQAMSEKNSSQIAFIAHKMLPMLRQLKARQVIEDLSKLEQQHELNLTEEQIIDLTKEAIQKCKTLLHHLAMEVRA